MLMKLEPGDSRKQSFADDVAGQVEHNRIICAPRDALRRRFEVKLSNVNAAQQPARKLSLIDEFLAALERQRCSPRLLCSRWIDDCCQYDQRDDCAQDETESDRSDRAHLK